MKENKSIKSDVVNIRTGKPLRQKKKSFFEKNTCDRCPNTLNSRKLSWFNDDVICMECAAKEIELKAELRKSGGNPLELEGCGYLPTCKDMCYVKDKKDPKK